MRREKLYLNDILESARNIERFVAGVAAEQFLEDEVE
jgi:uncharacterized protein with HEPN domain